MARLVACLILEAGCFLSSCSFPPPAPVMVHEGAYDTVVLEPLSEEIPAQHPVFIDQRVMEAILHSIYVQDDERLLQRLLSGRMPPAAVFSDEQSAIIARVLVTALARATSQQQVRFRLSHPQGQGEETTQGILYCAEPFLYFTLQQFHRGQPQTASDKPGRQLPDRTGLGSRRLIFQLPTYAGDMAENKSSTSLIIDYVHIQQWLASRDAADAATAGRLSPLPSPANLETSGPEGKDQAPAVRRTPSLNELIVRKDLEIESLKEEIRSLRQALEAQQHDINRLKRLLDNTQRR
ncbi:MAG: hypothetical protein M3Z35_03090 [Nitrospirota bacterium]|nr:hypothetical protein [Nitrospirota bacterium]